MSAASRAPSVAAKGLLWVTNYSPEHRLGDRPGDEQGGGQADPGRRGPVRASSPGAGSIWTHGFKTNLLVRINPRSRKVTKRIKIGQGSYDVLFAAGSVWVTNNSENTVSRVSPAHEPRRQDDHGSERAGRARVRRRRVWVGTLFSDVYRIDPATNRRPRSVGTTAPVWFAGRRRPLWVANGQTAPHPARLPHRQGDDDRQDGIQPVDGTVGPTGSSGSRTWGRDGHAARPADREPLSSTLPRGQVAVRAQRDFGDVWSPDYGGNTIWRIKAS